jgi:hypothetical protein
MAITNGYCSLAEVKAALRITDLVDDALLELSVEAASREIDGYCQRIFYQRTAQTRVYTPESYFLCQTDDIVTLTTLQTATDGSNFDTTWAAADYQLEPLNGVSGGLQGQPFTRIRAVDNNVFPMYMLSEATVRITGTFGWPAVPVDVKQACLLLAMRQFKRYDSPLGVAGFGDMGALRVGRTDPDVEALLSPYKRAVAA